MSITTPSSPLHRPSRWHRLRAFIDRHRLASLLIAGATLIAVALWVAFSLWGPPPFLADLAPGKVRSEQKWYSPLTGRPVADEAATKTAVTAIMIENSPEARPQSGLKQAGVVYEAIAEGGITRFLALYQHDLPGLVGPVRSLRPYYLEWAAPYNASIAHVGGSKAALDEVRSGGYRDLDQFFNGGSFWRASDRHPPHNVYTNFERLQALNSAKGYTSSSFQSFPRTDGQPAEAPDATNLTVRISGPTYNSHYTYDKAHNHYVRYQAGAPHTDREAGAITPTVVVVITVPMAMAMEDGYREQITTSGSGEAVVFQNGTATKATWRKANRAGALSLHDSDGQPLALARGQTWITAIPRAYGSVQWR